VNAFIEITPFDVVKYELEKSSGDLRVDRPQRLSSTPPTLYGFLPRTLCDDGDALDICVFSERPVNRSEIIVECRVVGGLTMIDAGREDDKIIAVLKDDAIWSGVTTIDELPPTLVERLVHYFCTYKMRPGHPSTAQVQGSYGPARAHQVILKAMADYAAAMPGGESRTARD
jgi:inorganic pyrophosphatase